MDTQPITALLPSIRWANLTPNAQISALARPAVSIADRRICAEILQAVRERGDDAVIELTERFDQVRLSSLQVPSRQVAEAWHAIPEAQRRALDTAYNNIYTFHKAQIQPDLRVQTAPGVSCENTYRAIDAVGLYVPGGTAPLPSTVLMLGVPSLLAGCKRRILCTPPQANGSVNPLILAAAARCGIDEVFTIGGAQGIAAMAYGTALVPSVEKIYGPGNPWVTCAKQLAAQDPDGAAYDMPAGPSEVLVIADDKADPAAVSADLLSQAEHGADSQVLLVVTQEQQAEKVRQCLQQQLAQLPRARLAIAALTNSRCFVVDSLNAAIRLSNQYAPEHLIINARSARELLAQVTSAGSVFLGPWSPEAIGDYCSGTNHVLPTHGHARTTSGIGVRDFQKCITVQELSREGLQNIGWAASTLAQAEGLDAHALAVDVRLASEGVQH